jgi:hypothetical protein
LFNSCDQGGHSLVAELSGSLPRRKMSATCKIKWKTFYTFFSTMGNKVLKTEITIKFLSSFLLPCVTYGLAFTFAISFVLYRPKQTNFRQTIRIML